MFTETKKTTTTKKVLLSLLASVFFKNKEMELHVKKTIFVLI